MTLNEIKISALQLMFVNYEEDLTLTNADGTPKFDADDPSLKAEYRQYLVNMNPVINRCLNRIMQSCALPESIAEIQASNCDKIESTRLLRFPISLIGKTAGGTFKEDCYKVESVSYREGGRYFENIDFKIEGNTIVVKKLYNGTGNYIVSYDRIPDRIALNAPKDTVVDLPDYIAELIPYFIESELYKEEQPQLAIDARNIFETMLDSYAVKMTGYQGGVVNIY